MVFTGVGWGNRKKRPRPKRKGQATTSGAIAEWVADCPWSGASRLRVEPGGLGRELVSERDSEGTSPVYGKGLAAFLFLASVGVQGTKKDDKTAAPGDQQASFTRQRRDFLAADWRNDKEAAKKDKGAAMRRNEERKKHDRLRSLRSTRRATRLF
ncbi:MAG: hypothetical protein PHI28_02900, partial [Mangrovibacterium sp.]|nr:hypothetical protein [Mangrovibacterium sp.]